MFRRSRAFTELGYYFRALNDISYCLRNQVAQAHQTPGVNNFQAYYWEVGAFKADMQFVVDSPLFSIQTYFFPAFFLLRCPMYKVFPPIFKA